MGDFSLIACRKICAYYQLQEAEVFILLQKLWTEKLKVQIVLSVLVPKHLESRSKTKKTDVDPDVHPYQL